MLRNITFFSVADLEGAEPAPTTFGRRTDAFTHGHVS